MKFAWEHHWTEAFAFAFIALGFVLAVLLQNAVLSYISVLLGGLVAGRIYYLKRYTEPILPFVLMILGFLLGYFAGSVWTSRVYVIMYYAIGFALSYYLHFKKIVATFKNEDYVK